VRTTHTDCCTFVQVPSDMAEIAFPAQRD